MSNYIALQRQATALIRAEMDREGLTKWTLHYSRGKRRLGYCTGAEAGELILERLPQEVEAEYKALIAVHGYRKVRNHIGKLVEL